MQSHLFDLALREVGGLLEQLNHSANEVNELEQELVKTQKAYERNAVAWCDATRNVVWPGIGKD